LIAEYRKKLKNAEERTEVKQSKGKLPIAVGSFSEVQCYACGGPHKKGDPSCKAAPFDVHSCAPAEFRSKQEEKKRKYGEKGGGRNSQPKKQRTGEKKSCKFFNFRKGTCRNGTKWFFLTTAVMIMASLQERVKEDLISDKNKVLRPWLRVNLRNVLQRWLRRLRKRAKRTKAIE
jgi:hypothetical protein